MAHSLYAAPDVVADLERTRLVGWADAYDLPAARWLLRITGRKPDIILNALAAQHAAIRAGLGIGVLPCFLGEGLVRVETSPPPVESLWLVAHATDATAERVRLVYERSEEHTSELQSLMRTSYAVFCLKKTKIKQ